MMSNQEFIDLARLKHGNKYNYSLVEYEYYSERVDIICPIHGVFTQSPRNHLLGKECKYCTKGNKRISPEFAIKQLQDKFPELDFSRFEYKKYEDDSVVMCSEHGEFLTNHKKMMKFKNFNGCPECKEGHNTHTRLGWRAVCKGRNSFVYLISIETPFDKCLKIGITTDLKMRFKGLKYEGVKVKQLDVMEFENPDNTFDMEKYLFKILKKYKYTTIHKFGGSTECFIDTSQIFYTFNLLKNHNERFEKTQ